MNFVFRTHRGWSSGDSRARAEAGRGFRARSRGARRAAARMTAPGLLLALALPALAADPMDIRRDATVTAVERVMPSVVNIATRTVVPVRDPFEQIYRQLWHQQPYDEYFSLGSGVVIDEAGYLLTNDHVVRRANQIAIRFGTGTNEFEATVVASDQITDVALLKITAPAGSKFRAIRLAREDDLLLGETVLALGNPLGLGGSVSRGILSSKSRTPPREGEPLDWRNYLQTDAPINPGNSGGPLVNLRGELIGINVGVVSTTQEGQPVQGIGFAIPIRDVENALSDIFPTEFVKSYWFGARVKVGTYPLVITSVQPESPAGRAGLKAGDDILQVQGKVPKSFIDFADLLASNAGAEIVITARRDGDLNEARLRLVPERTVFNADMVRDKLGLTLKPDPRAGFVIAEVEDDSPAAKAQLQNGMVLLGADGQGLSDVTALAKIIYGKKKGETVELLLAARLRAGNRTFWGRFTKELAAR